MPMADNTMTSQEGNAGDRTTDSQERRGDEADDEDDEHDDGDAVADGIVADPVEHIRVVVANGQDRHGVVLVAGRGRSLRGGLRRGCGGFRAGLPGAEVPSAVGSADASAGSAVASAPGSTTLPSAMNGAMAASRPGTAGQAMPLPARPLLTMSGNWSGMSPEPTR